MNKIQLDLPQSVCRALAENLADFEISSVQTVPSLVKKIRIGVIADKILNDFRYNFYIDKIYFNIKNQTASRDDIKIKLTEKEISLVTYLHKSAGFVARQDILQNVWQYSQAVDTRTVESHVHRLNQKFEDAFGSKIIQHKENAYHLVHC